MLFWNLQIHLDYPVAIDLISEVLVCSRRIVVMVLQSSQSEHCIRFLKIKDYINLV